MSKVANPSPNASPPPKRRLAVTFAKAAKRRRPGQIGSAQRSSVATATALEAQSGVVVPRKCIERAAGMK
jgi:hypothetical protein